MDSIVYEAAQRVVDRVAHAARLAIEIEGVPAREFTREGVRGLLVNIIEPRIVALLDVEVAIQIATDTMGNYERVLSTQKDLEDEFAAISASRTRFKAHWQGKRISVRFRLRPV